MKHLSNGLALSLALAAAPAAAQKYSEHQLDPISFLETLPGTICIVTPLGLATIYYQYQNEGIFAPYIESRAALKTSGSGWLSKPEQLAKGLTGTFEANAGQFDAKTAKWGQKPEWNIKVDIKSWNGSQPVGRCEGKGAGSMSGIIVSGDRYVPVSPGNPFIRHEIAPASFVPRSLLQFGKTS